MDVSIAKVFGGGVGYVLDGNSLMGPDTKLLHEFRVELVDHREIDALVPEEFQQFYLTQDADDLSLEVGDEDAVDATAEELCGPDQVFVALQRHERLLPKNGLDVTKWNAVSSLCALGDVVVQRDQVVGRLAQAHDDEDVGVQIAVVEGGDGSGACQIFADQHNTARRVLHKRLEGRQT